MKPAVAPRPPLRHLLLGGFFLLLALLAGPARAQFPAVTSQTLFVCNALGVQFGVQAFADGAGGAYSVWIDKRGGNQSGPGTALYAQHLSAAGVPLLPANGLRLFQTQGREIWGMRAIPWQTGILVAWVQGAFSIGGDTVRCQYYSAAGVAQWAQPTLVAVRVLPTIIYQSEQGLNIIPTSTGATITHALALNGGSNRFTYNQISLAGVRSFPMSDRQVLVLPVGVFASDYYYTVGDGSNGFYLVASASGFTSPIYAQRFDPAGGAAWANYTTVSAGGPSGRGSEWQPLTDPAGNLYVAWTSDSDDPLVSKVLPSGALGWAAPGYVNLCTNPSHQTGTDALWHNNALWMVWNDDRPSAFGTTQYMQKIDAAGTLAWPAAGVLVNSLPGVTNPKLAPSDNGAVMAFYATSNSQGFRAQKIRPDASLVFPVNGVVLHNVVNDRPDGADFALVAQPNGSVQAYWASVGGAPTGRDICAGRMQSSGTLLGAASRTAVALGFVAYPNPAVGELRLRYPPTGSAPAGLRLYDMRGRLMRVFAAPGPDGVLSLRGLAAGVYVLRAELGGQPVSTRVAVAE